MRRPLLGVLLLLAACDCGSYPAGSTAGEGGAGEGGRAGDGGAGSGGDGGAGGGGSGGGLAGRHFAQVMIGDCVDIEEWLSFGADGSFTHVWADRNACYDWSVVVGTGTWALDGAQLTMAWREPDGTERVESRSILLREEEVRPPPAAPQGAAVLHDGVLAQVAPDRWERREVIRWSPPDAAAREESLTTALHLWCTLTEPPGSCKLDLALHVELLAEGRTLRGDEAPSFPGAYGPREGEPLHAVVAEGFEQGPWAGPWPTFRGQPQELAVLLDRITRPLYRYDPADPAVLYDAYASRSWGERLDPPPLTVEELGPRP